MRAFKKELNYSLFLPVLLFLLLSVAVQVGATAFDHRHIQPVLFKQMLFCFLALLALFFTRSFSTKFLLKYAAAHYFFSLVLMAQLTWAYDPVLFQMTGTKRWLTIADIGFQPSELVKITFILFIVSVLLRYEKTHRDRTLKTDRKLLIRIFLYSFPTFLLMFMQKDFGTSLVFICILGALLVISGIHWKILAWLATILGLVGGLLLLLVFTHWGQEFLTLLHFKTYQLNRVKAWLDPFAYRDSIAYQQVQGLIAVGSGGMTGDYPQASFLRVPVRESDMIFTVIAGSTGFIGSSFVILLYFYLFYQMLIGALRTNQRSTLYFSVGYIFALLFQVFENIGALIGLLPLTGIPLPFLSQGGTSLITICMGMGVILGTSKEEV